MHRHYDKSIVQKVNVTDDVLVGLSLCSKATASAVSREEIIAHVAPKGDSPLPDGFN